MTQKSAGYYDKIFGYGNVTGRQEQADKGYQGIEFVVLTEQQKKIGHRLPLKQ